MVAPDRENSFSAQGSALVSNGSACQGKQSEGRSRPGPMQEHNLNSLTLLQSLAFSEQTPVKGGNGDAAHGTSADCGKGDLETLARSVQDQVRKKMRESVSPA